MKNLRTDEVEILAQIARYHRKAPPAPDHAEFDALPAPDQRRVMILGGIVRAADALDRTHAQLIARAQACATEETLLVRVQPVGAWDAEKTMFEAKRDMLAIAAGRAVVAGRRARDEVEARPANRFQVLQRPIGHRPTTQSGPCQAEDIG